MTMTLAASSTRTYRLYAKFFSPTHDSIVEDEGYRTIYQIKGLFLSLGHRYVICDAKGRELGVLRKKLVSLAASFTLDRPDAPLASIRRELLTPHRFQFTIDPGDGETLDVISRNGDHEYTVERGAGRLIATIGRGGYQAEDAYLVRVNADEDHLLMLACAMALDLACHDHEKDTEFLGEQTRQLQDWACVTLSRIVYGVSQGIRRLLGVGKGRK